MHDFFTKKKIMTSYKTSLIKLQKSKIMQNTFSNNNGIKLESSLLLEQIQFLIIKLCGSWNFPKFLHSDCFPLWDFLSSLSRFFSCLNSVFCFSLKVTTGDCPQFKQNKIYKNWKLINSFLSSRYQHLSNICFLLVFYCAFW
jgi:hypothetical protein